MPVHTVPLVADSFIFPEREYGIVGGGANETSLLQQAINDASSQGRILVLPPFEITVSQVVIPTAGVTIVGQSGVGGAPSSIIKSDGTNTDVIRIQSNVQNTLLSNFRVKGNNTGSNQHGIYAGGTGANMFVLDRIVVENMGGYGIRINSQNFNYRLQNVFVNDCSEDLFFIDATNAPASKLTNCYAGLVRANKSGYWIVGGQLEMNNCNGINGSNAGTTCLKLGTGSTVALVYCTNCNFESFTSFGIMGEDGSDIVLLAGNSFVAPASGTVQPIYLVGPRKSYIDQTTKFVTAGAVYDNAANLPIKTFANFIDCPTSIDAILSSKITEFWSGEVAAARPLANVGQRLATVSTAANYTEARCMANYIGVTNTGSARTITLFDPSHSQCIPGRIIVIKDESGGAGTNNITIQCSGGANIDGAATKVINTNYGSVMLVHRNNQYWTI